LFSPRLDVAVFAGSAALSLLALALGAWLGLLRRGTPDWTWIAAVLLVDVAHVYATVFRVYLDVGELRRRPWLYGLTPLVGWMLGALLYAQGELVFWRVLAYLAVFHFVRQQYGWVALYRARLGEREALGRAIDTAAIYAATLYPLLWWHMHLPRRFWWFLERDFSAPLALPQSLESVAHGLYVLIMAAYLARSLSCWMEGRPNPGKDMVVATTAVCWYVGIITLNSDYAFTVTNVLIHGIPYLALLYFYGVDRLSAREPGWQPYRLFARGPLPFLLVLWALAFAEELVWDRGVWHDRSWLFGAAWHVEKWQVWLVPLLALPQLVHYILDGFIWKRRSSAFFSRLFGS
jgi:hypothetical protein